MCREIEYRAWIPSWEEMVFSIDSEDINGVFWQLTNKGFVLSIDTCDEYGGGYKDFEGVILMQYTSIKDKNGVKCFYDDVIRIKLGEDYYQFVVAKVDGNTVILDMHNHGAVYDFLIVYKDEFEVIGNIHENKEFLNE